MIERSLRIEGRIFLLVAVIWFSGCAPVFPRELTDRVDRRVSFKELQSDPEKFKGTWVMLGGVIVSSKNFKEGTLIEVLQEPLDNAGRPLETDKTEGRFLVQSDQFLDSAVYHPGRLITFVGEIIGRKALPLDEIIYQYLLLADKASHLWSPPTGSHFFFGIGVSGRM